MSFHFQPGSDFQHLVSRRELETRIGEKVQFFSDAWREELEQFAGQFVLLFISEDLGPQGNLGFGGSKNGVETLLKSLFTVQSNRFWSGDNLGIMGVCSFEKDLVNLSEIRDAVAELDQHLETYLDAVVASGKTPLIVGGGHNNSYPILRSFGKETPINTINFDPHADFRPLEGRHSGNGFSYAMEHGFLRKYGIFGLHESYNSETMLEKMDKMQSVVQYVTFESHLDHGIDASLKKLEELLIFLDDGDCGMELDLDSISHFPSSAIGPSGFSLNETRQLLRKALKRRKFSYLHLPEGHFEENPIWAKGVSYIIADFIKTQQQW